MRTFLLILPLFAFLSSCSVSHTLPSEKPLLPHHDEAKWWIINSVSKDRNGKDIHLCALVSMEFASGEKYGGCFLSAWSEADSTFYSGVQNSIDPDLQFKEQFPVSISNSDNDSVSGGWSWAMKRSNTTLEGIVNKKNGFPIQPASFKASLSYETQKPFVLSHMLSSPDVWIVKPLNTRVTLEGNLKSASIGKLFVNTITGRTILFERAKKDFVTWLDLALDTGEQISLLFRTDNKGNVKVDAALLWAKNGDFMLKSGIEVKMNEHYTGGVGSKSYPLFYSINLPGSNINISERPRMLNQEVENNKSSFWMGAVEVVDPNTGIRQGKGNMYIFKQ